MNDTINITPEAKLHWDEAIARKFASSLYSVPISANHITLIALVLTLLSGILFASGETWEADIAALIFMFVRFLDHLDGELARIKKTESKFGHYFDWFVDTFSYVYLFIALGIGFNNKMNPVLLTFIVSLACIACIINTLVGIVKEKERIEQRNQSFPVIAGFSIDDGMYLIGPVTWSGFLFPFFLLTSIGAVVYAVMAIVKASLINY